MEIPAAPPAQDAAWSRRPARAVARLQGRRILLLSARDLLAAVAAERTLLIALVAPTPAAMLGFARAARDCGAPLLLVRPSGAADERGPEEPRGDAAFIEASLQAAAELRFSGPLALLKEPPWAGSAVPERERVQSEIEAGFTGVCVAAQAGQAKAARDAALAAAAVCQLELGLEVVPLGGSSEAAGELARQLRSRGSPPSALRLVGDEPPPDESEIGGVALSTTNELSLDELQEQGVRQLVASGPFLRALDRTAPPDLLERLHAWADERGATLEQSAARHFRLLRDLPEAVQEKLEALCWFEAAELFARAGVAGSGPKLAAHVGLLAQKEA